MPDSLTQENEFDEIRPYYDDEVNEAIHRLLKDAAFVKFIQYLFPQWDSNSLKETLGKITSVKEFQKKLMYPAVNVIRDKTIRSISHSGFENKKKDEAYLYISNHRDIILDSALLNVQLFEEGLDTCDVAIGSNLLVRPWIKDLVRINKNFIVHRDIPSKQLYPYSLRLSRYIREDLVEKKISVWLAQRQGRTKNGHDVTQAGLLKMLSISGDANFIENFGVLRIVPMTISYEYEPCDFLKARELYILEKMGKYTKKPGDDLKSMFVGLTSYKGRVHIHLEDPLNEELHTIDHLKNKNDQIKELSTIIDRKIYANYKLWPTNYIAHDMISGKAEFAAYYSTSEKEAFEKHIEATLKKLEEPAEGIKPILLKMYATPVVNKYNSKEKGSTAEEV